jgi:hypothetical protein
MHISAIGAEWILEQGGFVSKDPLTGLVDDYRNRFRLSDQLAFYRGLDSLEMVIDYAAMAKRADGKKHPHQQRLKPQNLLLLRNNLLENQAQLEASQSFADIIHLVRSCAVAGVGELAIYDTALRLGAYLDKFPDYVYLHAGTRKGAGVLGLKADREYLVIDELPPAMRVLKPYEAEDFLCIYKEQLKHPEAYAGENIASCHKPDLPDDHCHPRETPAATKTKPGC